MGNSPLICRANQWAGFYMIKTSDMKELKKEVQNRNITNNGSHWRSSKFS